MLANLGMVPAPASQICRIGDTAFLPVGYRSQLPLSYEPLLPPFYFLSTAGLNHDAQS